MRTVVWRTGALGDLVLTLPVLHALADAGPVTLIAPARYATLFDRADRWIDADGAEALAWLAGRVRSDAALGVAWTATGAAALRAAGVREVLQGTPLPPEGMHAADALWAPLTARLGPRDRDPVIPGASRPGPTVVISPGSGGARKRWPLARWRAVADALDALGVPVTWVGGPVEAGEDWGVPRRDDLDLAGLLALARTCRAWLGPDSGPLHLAAAAGARAGVVFNGATDPRCWRPLPSTVFADDADPAALARFAVEPR